MYSSRRLGLSDLSINIQTLNCTTKITGEKAINANVIFKSESLRAYEKILKTFVNDDYSLFKKTDFGDFCSAFLNKIMIIIMILSDQLIKLVITLLNYILNI